MVFEMMNSCIPCNLRHCTFIPKLLQDTAVALFFPLPISVLQVVLPNVCVNENGLDADYCSFKAAAHRKRRTHFVGIVYNRCLGVKIQIYFHGSVTGQCSAQWACHWQSLPPVQWRKKDWETK